jgi:putative effector of murein hydrolase
MSKLFFLQKIMTLVLLTLTCYFQISQYDSNISRAFSNPSLLSDKITVSLNGKSFKVNFNMYTGVNSCAKYND